MSVLILGGKGYLGGHFLAIYKDASAPSVDIADARAVDEMLDREKPDVIINAAGKTGRPNVDWCEDHKMETIRSNVMGPLVLIEACAKRGIYLVQLGSGCVYQGDNGGRGFTENDPPNFTGSFYSRTKGWMDQIMQDFPVLNLRLRMPFDSSQNERNLIMKLRRYSQVIDVQNSITHLPDFLAVAHTLIEKRVTGTYNVVNPGTISPYEIMVMYKEIVDPSHACERIDIKQLSGVVRAGRSNCALSTEKLHSEGIDIPDVHETMQKVLREMKVNGV